MKLIQAFTAAAIHCFGACAFAASIPVPNFSFEQPDVTEGTPSAVSGWTAIPIGGGGTPAVRDPVNAQYISSTGNNALLPGTADGGQAAYFGFRENGTGMTTSLTGTTIQANTLYLLTVAVGNPLDQEPGTVLLRLTVNGNVAVTNTILPTSIPNGTFTDFSVAFGPLVSTDSRIGGSLGIEL